MMGRGSEKNWRNEVKIKHFAFFFFQFFFSFQSDFEYPTFSKFYFSLSVFMNVFLKFFFQLKI